MSTDRYDVIIIGTGAGGGTLARRLAGSGKRILLLDNAEPDRITTSEKKPLLVDFFVLWRITNVKQYYVSVQQGDE